MPFPGLSIWRKVISAGIILKATMSFRESLINVAHDNYLCEYLSQLSQLASSSSESSSLSICPWLRYHSLGLSFREHIPYAIYAMLSVPAPSMLMSTQNYSIQSYQTRFTCFKLYHASILAMLQKSTFKLRAGQPTWYIAREEARFVWKIAMGAVKKEAKCACSQVLLIRIPQRSTPLVLLASSKRARSPPIDKWFLGWPTVRSSFSEQLAMIILASSWELKQWLRR